MLIEAVGGWLVNSLALIADAGHMLTDVAAMSLTLVSFWFAARPATAQKTFGYYRSEILAAFINGIALVLISIWVIYEAVLRWRSPQDVQGREMTYIAIGGLVINIISARLLHGDHENDLNIRGAYLHVIGDLLGSVAAIVAGVFVYYMGWAWADAAASIAISIIIILGAWRLVADSVNILLEGTPRGLDLSLVESTIRSVDGVTGVHDLHVWTISSGVDALSAHISHDRSAEQTALLGIVRSRLHDAFDIDHLTIQMEAEGLETEAIYVCGTGTKCFKAAECK